MNLQIDNNHTKLSWKYQNKVITIEKEKIIDAKYFEEEGLILLIYEKSDEDYPLIIGFNLDGTERFTFRSKDDFGVVRFTTQRGIKIPVVGWIKENNEYNEYYFSINPNNGTLVKYGRAY